jgi:hypothetical protein
MDLAFMSAMAFAIGLGLCFFAFMDSTPRITSSTLLARAEAWDSVGGKNTSAGVIRQTVRIKTSKQALDREIYRDAKGLQKVKRQKLNREELQLKQKLEAAGVTWDTPLSVAAYHDWHDRQTTRRDQIKELDRKFLVLTTTTPNGTVAAQSLTVRDYDFHPIARTIVFRDREEIQIAELDYRVLPWSSVNPDLFESTGLLRSSGSRHVQSDAMSSLPSALTDSQLDEVELGVRLVLNQLDADTGEQIQIVRTASGVVVQGLVETDQRRRDLVEHLHLVPHVKTSIVSIAEALRQNAASEPGVSEAQTVSVSTQPSPLEAYFVAHGRDASALHSLSQQLLHDALTISQESRAISDLLNRFAGRGRMTDLGNATLLELVYTHRNKLLQVLNEEHAVLRDVMPTLVLNDLSSSDASKTEPDSLVNAAERNLTLCEELTLGSSKQPRNAELIIPELTASLSEVHASTHHAQVNMAQTEPRNAKR